MNTGRYSAKHGPWMPVLKEFEDTYTFTPEELSALLRKAYADGYQSAKAFYNSSTKACNAVKESEHGTN